MATEPSYMHVVHGTTLEISTKALSRLSDDLVHSLQEKRYYNELFAEGNEVSLYVSGCPALILAVIVVKKFTEQVRHEVCRLLVDDEVQGDVENEYIQLKFINDQPGFSAKCILRTCMY